MVKKVAANRVVIDADTVISNAVVDKDVDGMVISVFPLAMCRFETASTAFYNGVITSEIKRKPMVGDYLPSLVTYPLEYGYSGSLFLWQGLSLEEMVVEENTVYTIL